MTEMKEKNNRPLITFALFAYNQEKYIREAVEGAFAQTYEPLEIILSDDCSTDRTFEVMQEMTAAYDGKHEVRLRRNDINLGLAGHINAILASANGDIVCWAAGDDISFPKRTEILAQPLIESSDIIGVHSTVWEIDLLSRLGDIRQHADHVKNVTLRSVICDGGGVVSQAHAFRKIAFEQFGPLQEFLTNEGPAMAFRELLLGRIMYIPEPTVYYRIGSGVSTYAGNSPELLKSLEPIKYAKWRLTAARQMIEDLQKVDFKDSEEVRSILKKRERFYQNLLNINLAYKPFFSLVSNILLVGFERASIRAYLRVVCPKIIYSIYISFRK